MTFLTLGSATAAQRAKALLSRRGIRSQLRRRTGPEGCQWSLALPGRVAEARALLAQAGIPVEAVSAGGRP